MAFYDGQKYIILDGSLRPFNKPAYTSIGKANHLRGGYHIYDTEADLYTIPYSAIQAYFIPESQIL